MKIQMEVFVIHSFNDDGELLSDEKDTINLLAKLPLDSIDLDAISVVTNIYKVAQGLRNKMEREVLSEFGYLGLHFHCFTICGSGYR